MLAVGKQEVSGIFCPFYLDQRTAVPRRNYTEPYVINWRFLYLFADFANHNLVDLLVVASC